MLLANNLSFHRDGKEIFKELDISLSSKKIIHLQGRNGIGKTTLIKILATMLIPSTGEIYWNGKNIKKNFNEFFSNLTYIMDAKTSKNEMTVNETIKYWVRLFSSSVKTKEIDAMIDLLALENYKNQRISLLATGEIKKLELSRLVIEKKKFWLLDEPYTGLDKSTIELINETFENHIKNDGMIIFASHYHPNLKNMHSIHLENYANN